MTFRGDVDFDHVTFRYQDADEPALRTSTSTSRPARRSASSAAPLPASLTLVQLMLGFRMPTEGSIRF